MLGRRGCAVAALLAVACTAPADRATDPRPAPTSGPAEAAEFLPPPSSDVLGRALRTDLCALLDEDALAELGWRRGTAQSETLTSCAAASQDQERSVVLSVDTAVSDRPAPADGDRCTRLRIVDQTTMIAIKAQLRTESDPCAAADRFLATAAQRFEAGAGQHEPPNSWIALDACELLPPLLPIAARTLGGAKPTLRELRRLGPRGCIATHTAGEVTLSVSPAPGRVADLDGDEVAVAGRPGRLLDLEGACLLRLVGRPLDRAVQVATIEVRAATDRCTVATAMAEALVSTLPAP